MLEALELHAFIKLPHTLRHVLVREIKLKWSNRLLVTLERGIVADISKAMDNGERYYRYIDALEDKNGRSQNPSRREGE